VTLFCQDRGTLLGLRVVGNQPDRFARVVVANGRLPVVPFLIQLVSLPNPPVLDPGLPFPPLGTETCAPADFSCFGRWATYALTSPHLRPSGVVEAITTNVAARAVFDAFEKPVLTLFGRRDSNLGSDAVQAERRDRVPGAVGQPHHAPCPCTRRRNDPRHGATDPVPAPRR
jgi:haloalkane dehalogenase